MSLRHYNDGEAEFILEPVNDSVVKVSHRSQVGWIGISLDWDPQRPYTTTTFSHRLKDDGIERIGSEYATPDDALKSLCRWLLRQQRREDSRSVNLEERTLLGGCFASSWTNCPTETGIGREPNGPERNHGEQPVWRRAATSPG